MDREIVQTDRVYHTGADLMERIELVPNPNDVRLIKERFQNEFIEIFGIKPEALTANEARYLVGFRSLDELRGRLVKAEQEIDRRLCSKGISRSGGSAAGL